MKQKFIKHISSLTSLSKEEEDSLLENLVINHFKKGDVILSEGEYSKNTFLILEGCIRRHRNIDGLDKTTGFFTEGDAVAEFEGLWTNKPALHSYSCV